MTLATVQSPASASTTRLLNVRRPEHRRQVEHVTAILHARPFVQRDVLRAVVLERLMEVGRTGIEQAGRRDALALGQGVIQR